MRLLFDANLSPRLVTRLCDLFPGSVHVCTAGLAGHTSDEIIWSYARAEDMVIVTADSDFLALAEERGAPPQIIRLENCNYRTPRVEHLLRRNAVRIAEFGRSSRSVLIIRNR